MLIHAFMHTPVGRICNAVRDNPERAEFVGYDPRRVRFIACAVAGLFAGVAGDVLTAGPGVHLAPTHYQDWVQTAH